MLGIDLTRISRFKNKNNSFVEKILHPDEIVEYESTNEKTLFLASHWAIKEAIFKVDNSYFHFNKIKINKKNKKYFFKKFIISTSQEEDFYIAIVMEEQWK